MLTTVIAMLLSRAPSFQSDDATGGCAPPTHRRERHGIQEMRHLTKKKRQKGDKNDSQQESQDDSCADLTRQKDAPKKKFGTDRPL